MAVGIRPNVQLAKDAGLEVKRGLVVDDHLRTNDDHIFAVGECVEHRGQCYGLVAPLYDMAKTLAAKLAGDDVAPYTGSVTSTKLKVTGVDLFSAGDFSEGDEKDEIVLRDPSRGVYKRVVLRDNRIVGAVLYGDTADGAWYFDLLKKGADITKMHDTLIFGQAYQGGGAPLDPVAMVAEPLGRCGDLRLQRRLQGRDYAGDHRARPDDDRRRARRHQGVRLLRPVHLEGRGAAGRDAGRRLRGRRAQADVQVHRPDPRGSARLHRGEGTEVGARGDAGTRLEDVVRLPVLPPGAELLSALRLAVRISRRCRSRASSTSACTPTSRRTARSRWCRACGAA